MGNNSALIALAREIVKGAEGDSKVHYSDTNYVRHAGQKTAKQRDRMDAKFLKKEAALTQALQNSAGLSKIAANMANPVRFRLDYKGIWRKFAIVEQIPDGVPIIYDKDQQLVPAVKAGKFGSVRQVQMTGKRVTLEPFEILSRVKIPYSELYNRRYRALDRAKDRLIEGMELREDLQGFGLFFAASTLVNTPVSTTGVYDRDLQARSYNAIEQNRLVVGSNLLSTAAVMGIRRLQFQDMDQVGMQEIRETGYLGSFWGADYYVTDQIPQGISYSLATPKYLAWLAIRKDVDVIPADDPDNVRLGFLGYELIAMTVFNALGVEQMQFNPAA